MEFCVFELVWVQNFNLILSFWTKFTQKSYFQLKAEQAVQGLQAFTF